MAEFHLAAECCRAAFGDADSSKIGQLAEKADWPRFLTLVRFHRVQGLVWKTLATTDVGQPASIAEAIATDARAIAAANLSASVECGELQRRFDGAGINGLFLKGLTLGALAYGIPWVKAAVDIDLLVSPAHLMGAAAVFGEAGYELCLPPSNLASLRKWHRLHKESAWSHRGSGSQIDLHTRLADNPRLIPTIGLASPRQEVQIADGLALPTLAKDELLAYLAVHGASSAWFRLKWVTDLAALLHQSTAEEIEHLYRRSQQLAAGRAAAQALLLADALYETLDGLPHLKRELEADRASRWLTQVALRQLAREEPVEPTAVRGGTAAIHYTQLMLLPGLGFKLSELVRQVRVALA